MDNRLWSIKEYPFHPEKLRYYETIFAIGNGYLGSRANFEEGFEDDTPATLIHGIYNQSPTMSIPELVNTPNWTPINITVDGTPFQLITKADDPLKPKNGLVIGYERKLHMDQGLLQRVVLFRAKTGATVRIVFERFVSLDNIHIMAQRVHITAIDGAPKIELSVSIDTDVTNAGHQHWNTFTTNANSDGIIAYSTTNQSGYELAVASQFVSKSAVEGDMTTPSKPALNTSVRLDKDDSVTSDKLTAIVTSRDSDACLETAQRKLSEAIEQGYDALLANHLDQWQSYWNAMDIQIEGDEAAQIGVRFTTYHIMIAAPRNDDDVSIGAKTLSGLGYKGHVFWDTELFMLPPFTLTVPTVAKNMLMYRYHRLEGAREKARAEGYEGAMFPWESTDTGLETTPKWSDPFPDGTKIRIWTGDNEQHISTDIAYAIQQYWQWTGDDEFYINYGAEIILDTAVFWASRVQEIDGQYELHDQIGPDEYHENINNSVFVNRMVVWHLEQALELVNWLNDNAPEKAESLIEQLGINDDITSKWSSIIGNMVIPFDEEKQIHIQFDGFFDMEYIPVPKYSPRVGGIWGYLGHERALQSQVIKQADVVMLMALLGNDLASKDVLLNNWETYYPRCDHGSSLSPAMHSWVAARLGLMEDAYYMFEHAFNIDLEDNKGNVPDGIHGAASGGLWQALVFGFCGLHIKDGKPEVDPNLPSHWKQVSFSVVYRGERHEFTVSPARLTTP